MKMGEHHLFSDLESGTKRMGLPEKEKRKARILLGIFSMCVIILVAAVLVCGSGEAAQRTKMTAEHEKVANCELDSSVGPTRSEWNFQETLNNITLDPQMKTDLGEEGLQNAIGFFDGLSARCDAEMANLFEKVFATSCKEETLLRLALMFAGFEKNGFGFGPAFRFGPEDKKAFSCFCTDEEPEAEEEKRFHKFLQDVLRSMQAIAHSPPRKGVNEGYVQTFGRALQLPDFQISNEGSRFPRDCIDFRRFGDFSPEAPGSEKTKRQPKDKDYIRFTASCDWHQDPAVEHGIRLGVTFTDTETTGDRSSCTKFCMPESPTKLISPWDCDNTGICYEMSETAKWNRNIVRLSEERRTAELRNGKVAQLQMWSDRDFWTDKDDGDRRSWHRGPRFEECSGKWRVFCHYRHGAATWKEWFDSVRSTTVSL